MTGKGKKQEEQRPPSPPSLQQPSSSRVQRSPPQATSSGEGRNKSNPKGGATSKAESTGGCSLCCVALLSVLVAVAAVVGYAAFVAFPTESEQLLREIDSRVQKVVRNLDDFVKTNLNRILNKSPHTTDEKLSEAKKTWDDERIDHEQHDEGSLKEERKERDPDGEHGSGSVEEFDQVEPQGKVWNGEETAENNIGENFEPEILIVEKEDLGGEIFEQGVREVGVDAAEYEEKVDEELEEEEEDVVEESEDLQDDPAHRWEMVEGLEGTAEDAAGEHFEESDGDVLKDGHEMEPPQEIGSDVASEVEEEVTETEDTKEPWVAPHEALHLEPQQVIPESVAAEPIEEEDPGEILLKVDPERTKKEIEIKDEVPPLEQKVPVQGVTEEVTPNQDILEEEEVEEAESREAPTQEDFPSGDESEAVTPNEEPLPSQETPSEE